MAVTKGFIPRTPLPKSEIGADEEVALPTNAGERLALRAKRYTDPNAPETYKPYYALRKAHHFTDPKKEIFIFTLAECGTVADAADAARVSMGTARNHRNPNHNRYDPLFDEAWDDAIQEYNAGVEKEIHERAITGWQEPVFGGREKDQIVGHITRKSDRLLTVLAKRRMPQEYGDKVAITNPGGSVGVSTEIAPGIDIANLTTDQRKKLRDFLTSVDGVDRSDVIDLIHDEVETDASGLLDGDPDLYDDPSNPVPIPKQIDHKEIPDDD